MSGALYRSVKEGAGGGGMGALSQGYSIHVPAQLAVYLIRVVSCILCMTVPTF